MICWIESVDSVADFCLTNQIYSELLNAFEFKEITEMQSDHLKIIASPRDRTLASEKGGVGNVDENNPGRFPFDQIFRFEIPGVLCDEWNSIFRFVGLTNPRSSGSKFRAKIRDQTEGTFAEDEGEDSLDLNAINFLSRSDRTRSGRVISLSHRALASYQ